MTPWRKSYICAWLKPQALTNKVMELQNLNVRHLVGEQVYFTSVASGEMGK
jgi:hypothetical protein